jgi:hypothetical protein
MCFRNGEEKLRVSDFEPHRDLSSNSLEGELPPGISLWGREDPLDPDEDSVLAVVYVCSWAAAARSDPTFVFVSLLLTGTCRITISAAICPRS